MKYKNPYYKKTKKAFDMMVSCNHCGSDIARYRKKGKGGLLRLWVARMPESEFQVDLNDKSLKCPYCKEILANLIRIGPDYAYKMYRSSVNTRQID